MTPPQSLWDLLGSVCLVAVAGCAFAILCGIVEGIATAILGHNGILDRPKRRKP